MKDGTSTLEPIHGACASFTIVEDLVRNERRCSAEPWRTCCALCPALDLDVYPVVAFVVCRISASRPAHKLRLGDRHPSERMPLFSRLTT